MFLQQYPHSLLDGDVGVRRRHQQVHQRHAVWSVIVGASFEFGQGCRVEEFDVASLIGEGNHFRPRCLAMLIAAIVLCISATVSAPIAFM